MQGIAHPILWKASPQKTEIAIIAEYSHDEKTLRQAYLDEPANSAHVVPAAVELCSLVIKIVQVLDRIHSKKVRHGNLRPDVISFWVEDDEIHVCIRDFSESALIGERDTIASASPADDDMEPKISHDNACIFYLAPETFIRANYPSTPTDVSAYCSVDHRADFYSLGAVLYHILNGQPLFGQHLEDKTVLSEHVLEIIAAHCAQIPTPPTQGKEPLLDQVVLKLLQKTSELRYQTGTPSSSFC
jgi:serine/threonine protein kinase